MTARMPRGGATRRPCRACATLIPSRLYLCRACWALLPAPTRAALSRRDNRALLRLRVLYAHIDRELPLADLEIT